MPENPAFSFQDISAFRKDIRKWALRFVKRSEVDDLVQDVCLRALENLEGCRASWNVKGWLYGITRNTAMEIRRARNRQIPTEDKALDKKITPSLQLEEDLLRSEDAKALMKSFEKLDLEEKLVILMTYVDGLNAKEGAESLDISHANFRQKLSRARKKLGQKMKKE